MTVLIDTSAWIEYLRRADSRTALAVTSVIDNGTAATTDVVIMEVLAGTTDGDRLLSWERVLEGTTYLPQAAREDAQAAAGLYRTCRRAGETPRQLTDCVVAAVAIRNNVPVLHNDRDYDVLARHTALEVSPL